MCERERVVCVLSAPTIISLSLKEKRVGGIGCTESCTKFLNVRKGDFMNSFGGRRELQTATVMPILVQKVNSAEQHSAARKTARGNQRLCQDTYWIHTGNEMVQT